jgi:hypothetical protein
MSMDRNNPAGTSDDQSGGEIESLDSAEIEGVDLETISGGMTISPAKVPTNTCVNCPAGFTIG